jgi:hypothetical protein
VFKNLSAEWSVILGLVLLCLIVAAVYYYWTLFWILGFLCLIVAAVYLSSIILWRGVIRPLARVTAYWWNRNPLKLIGVTLAASACMAVVTTGILFYRVGQVAQGVCLSEGRVLSDAELNERFFYNLLLHYKGTDLYEFHDLKNRVAFIDEDLNLERIKELIKLSSQNEKDISENFGLKYIDIDPREKTVNPETLQAYGQLIKNKGSLAVMGVDFLRIYRLSLIGENKPLLLPVTFWSKAQGYGMHERDVDDFNIFYLKWFKDSMGTEYKSIDKDTARQYLQNLSNIESNSSVVNKAHNAVRVSTCGEIKPRDFN